jgi:RND superfamily putative drug exporter
VIKTVGATGGVITSAGLIFAASMFGLTFSSISNIVQVGFIIGVGLLLDTFLVRTITVPAMAVLVGKTNWWPSKIHSTSGDDEDLDEISDDETKELVRVGPTLGADTDFTDVT